MRRGHNFRIVLLLLPMIFLGVGILYAQDVEYVGSTLRSDVWDVQVTDHYAYCTFANGLGIINISNPFNPTTTISYKLSKSGLVKLCIYNLTGQRVVTLVEDEQWAGAHNITWNATNFPSGIYFARLETEQDSQSIKMVLLK